MALQRLQHAQASKQVLIHDAARPFVSADLISHVIAELERPECVIPGLPIADTIKLAPGGLVERTVDRQSMWSVQTPQGFELDGYSRGPRKGPSAKASGDFTDDAAVAEKFAGIKVRVIMGASKTENSRRWKTFMSAIRILTARAIRESRRTFASARALIFTSLKLAISVVLVRRQNSP